LTLSALLVSGALAQSTPPPATSTPAATPPAQTTATPPAATPDSTTTAAPAPGANSFTEAQAKSRLEQNGYSSVSGLAKDDNGVWRGTAMKDGKTQAVALDFRGNIAVTPQ